MDKTREEVFKMMGRVEGLARTLQQMAKDGATMNEIEQQIKAIDGIVKRAKVATLRDDLKGAKDVDALLERIKKL